MKVARFSNNGKVLLGVVNDASGTVHPFDSNLTSMADLIRFSASGFSFTSASAPGLPLSEVTLLAPIIPERNIFCVGKNYYEHAKEFAGSGFEAGAVKGHEIDAYPAIF